MKSAWQELIELSDKLEKLGRNNSDKAEMLIETADNRKDVLLVEALIMIATLRNREAKPT